MTVPDRVRTDLKKRLWTLADEIGWLYLSGSAKAKRYERWTRDNDIGGVLSHYMDKGQVRVYIKDTLLKEYARNRLGNPTRIIEVLDLGAGDITEEYIKPHGRRFKDGRVICWGRAESWKTILMAVYERAYLYRGAKPYAAVLLHATGRFKEEPVRAMVESAAQHLGVERLLWLDL